MVIGIHVEIFSSSLEFYHWSQYIFSVLLFVWKNRKLFSINHDAHNLQTRQRSNLYLPTSTLTLYQKGVYFAGIKLFNNLPLEIKEIIGIHKQFKISLRRYLITHCFYDLKEYYSVNERCGKLMVLWEHPTYHHACYPITFCSSFLQRSYLYSAQQPIRFSSSSPTNQRSQQPLQV
jgi:hypothetical protein